MRGKRSISRSGFCFRRITPAHAGKTRAVAERAATAEDHPRACGENLLRFYVSASRLGSPPRMRGKLCAVCVKLSLPRITPAHAGKTVVFDGDASYKQDHPRACGENNPERLIEQ